MKKTFGLQEGDILSGKYTILQQVGAGWEGEVYLVKEVSTGVERSIKIFFPGRNNTNQTLRFYAKKLHKLRSCRALIQYHTQESFEFEGKRVKYLVSEFVDGELLSDFVARQRGKRLEPFQALHLLYALTKAIEEIHAKREYHGDLHTQNIILERHGLGFDMKLVDLFQWKEATTAENIQGDVYDMIQLFYEVLGGKEHYAHQPDAIKSIILGRRRDLIQRKFKSAAKLRSYIEQLEW